MADATRGRNEERRSVRECESVCYDRATTGLQENPSTRSAPWRLGHPTIGPSGDTSGGMDFDSIRLVSNGIDSSRIDPTRLDSLRLSPLFTLVHQAANFKILLNRIKRKVSYGSSELEGEAVDDSKRLISLVEKSLYIYIHVYSLSFRFVSSHSSEG